MTPTSPLRLLLWLKWTLLWRGYRASRAKLVGTIMMLLAFLPVSIGAAWLVWIVGTGEPALAPVLARDALAFLYFLWVTTPLLGFSLNESFDLTRLFAYPLSYRQIFAGSVLGSLLDMPVLLTLPTLGVLLALFCHTPGAWLLGVLLLTAFLLHTLALGQAVTLALIGFLRSRRFRDITIVLFPLIGMAYYVGQRVFFSHIEDFHLASLLDAPLWRLARWLPPGWTASALASAAKGDFENALLGLGLTTLAALLTLRAAAHVLQELYLGDRGPGVPRAPVATAMRAPSRLPAFRWGLLTRFVSPAARAVAEKEWTYLRREPQYKAMAVNVLYTLAAIGLPLLAPLVDYRPAVFGRMLTGEWLLYGVAGSILLAGLPLLFNIFGSEGAAVTTLLSFPTRRRDVFQGKNAAHGTVLLLLCAVTVTGLALATGEGRALPRALLLTALATPVLLAAGNIVSVRLPHRMLVRGQKWSKGGLASAGNSGEGCAYGTLYLLAYAATGALVLPAAAATLLPGRFGISALWLGATLPFAAGYAAVVYVAGLKLAEEWLATHEPELMERIVPEL